MAVKIEKGGWILIFLIGLGLVGYSLNKYGVINLGAVWAFGLRRSRADTGAKVDPTQPLDPPLPAEARTKCACGSTSGWAASAAWWPTAASTPQPGSIYADKGLKVSFKIIDDWTEGAAALATDNVDVMLTTADVWAKDFGQFQDKGVNARAFFMVDWSRGADGVIGKPGHQQHRGPGRQDRRLRALHALALPALERAEELRALHRAAQRDLRQGRAHQGRHRARHAVRPAEGGCRRGLGSGHERRRGQASRREEDLRHRASPTG